MKVEGDTAYEPDVLIRMERFEKILGDKKEVWREATIIKDRSTLLDGKVIKNPTFEDFAPIVEFLLSDVKEEKVTESTDDWEIIEDDEIDREISRLKKITLEEIWGVFGMLGLGTGKDDVKIKLSILERIFLTTSKLKIEEMPYEALVIKLEELRDDSEVKERMSETQKKGKK